MKKVSLFGIILIIEFLIVLNAYAEGDAKKGKAFFGVCLACHGQNAEGNKVLNAPLLAKLGDWYLVNQLEKFRTGHRGSHTKDIFGMQMKPMSMTLPNDQAVKDVAAYVSTLKPPAPEKTVKGDINKGKVKYDFCSTCHEKNGEGNSILNSPPLAGQHDWYLLRQLENFKNGIRGADSKNDAWGYQMAGMMVFLEKSQDYKDVIAYIATLK